MKYVKSFEAKRQNKVLQSKSNDYEDVKNSVRDEWELVDERSYVTFDKFFDNFPFDIFSEYNTELIDSAGIDAPRYIYNNYVTIDVKGQKLNFYSSSSYGISAPSYFNSDHDWIKRNLMIYITFKTGGASGGSCWDTGDDDGAQPYEVTPLDLSDFLEYLKPKLDVIVEGYANTKSASELIELLRQDYGIIHEDSYSHTEYYGNYDDYGVLYMTLYDLFKFLAKTDSF